MALVTMALSVFGMLGWVHELGTRPFSIAEWVAGWLSIVVVMVW